MPNDRDARKQVRDAILARVRYRWENRAQLMKEHQEREKDRKRQLRQQREARKTEARQKAEVSRIREALTHTHPTRPQPESA